jgi:hypothetical protein|tara:strand:+ start:199 stop:555 length:357 start_codon:yes stop_codon:yes gene_type:complete
MTLLGTIKDGIPPVKGVDILGIATFTLILLNLMFLFLGIRILGNLMTNLHERLNKDLAAAIESIIQQAQSIEMPDVNPLQMMVMEMIKNNLAKNNQDQVPPKEIKRNLDGTFKQDISL